MILSKLNKLRCFFKVFQNYLYSIFTRKDYPIDKNIHNIVDLGSNIGINAIYFLSRNNQNSVSLDEDDPNNLIYLKENLGPFRKSLNIQNIAFTSSSKLEMINF